MRRIIKFSPIILILAASLVFSLPARAGMPGAMKGVDMTYKSRPALTCSAAAQGCRRNFPASAAQCASAGATCKQTGTFTNPQGQSFTGLIRK